MGDTPVQLLEPSLPIQRFLQHVLSLQQCLTHFQPLPSHLIHGPMLPSSSATVSAFGVPIATEIVLAPRFGHRQYNARARNRFGSRETGSSIGSTALLPRLNQRGFAGENSVGKFQLVVKSRRPVSADRLSNIPSGRALSWLSSIWITWRADKPSKISA